MHDVPHQTQPEPHDLTILALDIRRFSDFTETERTRIATEFRDCVEASFAGDLAPVWNGRVFEQDGGDGIVVGFPRKHLRDIVDAVPAALQQELRKLHQRTGLNVRMRMGIGAGPIQYTPDTRVSTAPNQPIIDACRIADSEPARLLLENSDKDATFLAVAVTATVMTETIGPDPRGLRASEFVEVRVDTKKKQYQATAFLHVPSPSGALLRYGLLNLHGSPLSTDDSASPLEELIKHAKQTWPAAQGTAEVAAARIGSVDIDKESVRTGDVGERAVVAGANSRVHNDSRDQRSYVGRDSVVSHGGNARVTNVGRDEDRIRPFWLDEEDDRT
ncbi:hypothetical protein K3N28_19580 [Glycomyces sp. TRM65418]|uniref:hypothetical protein n=1 Tax=Glycomyces sp. TRM65418 TaxID=2867006 RepID=UPI001CE6C80A|nr:hypothetical protein [Glycomyces sp. TRM65418]MCC3765264.1 hypothetical protein [Glycomyces sp. TRM65418]QZD54885.1 hypothetical protein K3N28_19485 [Glycomyces sp. TRM65418]